MYKNNKLSNEENIERFIQLISKYILNPDPNQDKQDHIITLFRPSPILTGEINNAILPLINAYGLDRQKLMSLAQILQTFAHTTEEWVKTMCKIADTYIEKIDNQFINVAEIFGAS